MYKLNFLSRVLSLCFRLFIFSLIDEYGSVEGRKRNRNDEKTNAFLHGLYYIYRGLGGEGLRGCKHIIIVLQVALNRGQRG